MARVGRFCRWGTLVVGATVLAGTVLVPSGSGASTPGGRPPSATLQAVVNPVRNGPLRQTTAQVIADLATEGVAVYATPTSATPVDPVTAPSVPLTLLKSQAAEEASETTTGAGTPGSALDALGPMPSPPAGMAYAPFSYLLAAYATATATPGETLAGQLLGPQNWDDPEAIVFPQLVLTLFTADALRAAGTANGPLEAPVSAPSPVRFGGPAALCATLADYVSKGLSTVESALTVGPSSNTFVSFIGGLWNQAVSYAETAIPNIVSTISAPVTTAIQAGMGAVGVGSSVVSILRNLTADATADPAFNSFGVDPAGSTTGTANTGTVTVTVGNPKGFDWPSGLTECASHLGVTLPSLNAVEGATVDWTTTPIDGVPTDDWCADSCTLADEDTSSTQTTVQADHTAVYDYTTNTELADQAARGEKISGPDSVLVQATVTLDTAKLADLIKALVLAAVPGGLRIVTGPLARLLTAEVLSQFATMTQPTAFRYVLIDHHEIPEPLPFSACTGLLSTSDFPGTNTEDDQVAGQFSECVFVDQTNEQNPPPSGGVFIVNSWTDCTKTIDCVNEAEQSYADTAAGSPSGVGDQAWSQDKTYSCGTKSTPRTCTESLAGARVANDDFEIIDQSTSGPSALSLVEAVVHELCSDCTYPTSPQPT